MSARKFIVTSALFLVFFAATPAKASADWLFTPFIGVNFSGSAVFSDVLGDLEDDFGKSTTFGASLAWMGAGIIGFEVDFGYTDDFFQSSDDDVDLGDNNLMTLMGNLIVGIPIGGQTGGGVRPYASGGVGIIRTEINDPLDLVGDLSKSNWGLNVGGGLSGFFTDNVGAKGDIRYFRQFRDAERDDDLDIGLGGFSFWRGTVGIVFRF
jgi:opacity protein-like surface antigen